MRLNKLLTAILGGAFLLGSAACTDEVEYTPAPLYDGDEVFFSNELPSTINIPTETTTSVDVPIMRLRAADELTVGLTGSVTFPDGTDASSIFEVPTEVTFAADATTAEIPIAIIGEVENDVNYVLNLAIVSDQASPYGPTEVAVNLLYSPWTDLEPYSTTEYEGVMGAPWTGDPIGGVVYTAHSLINDYDEEWVFPGPRYSNLYFDYDLYVDKRNVMTIDGETVYRVTMPLTDTHYDNGEDRIMYIDAFTWMRLYGAENGASLSDAQINNIMANNGFGQSYYNPETGTFRLWLVPCVRGDEVARYGQSYTTLQLPGFVNYSIDFSVLGSFVTNGRESLVINATRSNDLASFAYTISAGELTEAQINAEAEAIAADTDADVYVEQSVNILFPFNEDGKYTLVAVGYDASGAAVYETSYVFDAQTVQAAREWESIGWCEYTDTFIYNLYNGDDTPEDEIIGGETWSVEVEENINTPGLYRLVNPYYFWVADIMGASSNYLDGNFYMTIDATDPQKVTMPVSELGVFLSPQEGQLITASVDQVLQNGTVNGVLEDGVITFGERGLVGSLQALFEQGRVYYCNLQGFFCVDMNAGSAPASQSNARKAPRVNLNNLKASAPVEAKVLMNRKQSLSNTQTRDFILSNVERNTIR